MMYSSSQTIVPWLFLLLLYFLLIRSNWFQMFDDTAGGGSEIKVRSFPCLHTRQTCVVSFTLMPFLSLHHWTV